MTEQNLRFTEEHEWLLPLEDGTFRIGITDFAQDSLGDIVYVALPEVGAEYGAGDPMGEVESTKSVSEVYAPFAGAVVARNDAVETAPETINSDPLNDGWLVVLKPADADLDLSGFLDKDAYDRLTST